MVVGELVDGLIDCLFVLVDHLHDEFHHLDAFLIFASQ
jgi:hypothetical protein